MLYNLQYNIGTVDTLFTQIHIIYTDVFLPISSVQTYDKNCNDACSLDDKKSRIHISLIAIRLLYY